ncbi:MULTISPECIES: aldehyde dehydrogenase family protein [Paenibacillus]|uniref:Aldehyde dehydrogenase family protein n=1 Tax=Paenibacillus validus TaxID=44253 RepID=A0A7X2Z911_9BACL|nr:MULTISPECIES: aldehyde dehydrogenase family protein [Paenibacillus]MUG69935.1 aldehyde dehydrogenase family protein [Paenibacillus validus]
MGVDKLHLLINNEDVETGQYTEVKDPGRYTDVVGLVAKGTVQHVEQAVQAAHQAFASWRQTSLEERSALFMQAAKLLEEDTSSLSEMLTRENGMLLNDAAMEVGLSPYVIYLTLENAQAFFQSKQAEDEVSFVSVEKRPIGVIAAIVPWNAPFVLTLQKLVPAVLAGNTIVIKPSPNAPISISRALRKMAALFPDGVINVIHGDTDVGTALTTHPLVRKITFTGGGKTAKHIMKGAADSLKGVHFELGGNDPAIVLDDADLDEVVPKIVQGAFWRSGQICFDIKRVYVPQAMYDAFYRRTCDLVDAYKVGHGLNPDATLGPVNNKLQYQYVKELIEGARQSGAKVIELGQKLEPANWDNGYFLQPAVVGDVEPGQDIVTCEQFGPVIPLIAYRSEEEALRMANMTEYGLASSVWSSDFERALRVTREIEAGMTFINGHGQSPLGAKLMPFGGVKQSGIGRENSEVGLAEYIEYHAINYHKQSH